MSEISTNENETDDFLPYRTKYGFQCSKGTNEAIIHISKRLSRLMGDRRGRVNRSDVLAEAIELLRKDVDARYEKMIMPSVEKDNTQLIGRG